MVLKELYFQKTNADKHKKNKRYVHIENKNKKQFKGIQDEKKVTTSIEYKKCTICYCTNYFWTGSYYPVKSCFTN